MENSGDVRRCCFVHQRRVFSQIALAAFIALASLSGSAFGQGGEILTPLMIAAKNGSVATVRTLTAIPIGINSQTVSMEIRFHGTPMSGRTALMFAAQEGHAEVVQILLDRGADPNLKDSYGGSAWTYARDAHQLKILVLLWPKLDLKTRSNDADWALYASAEAGYLDIAEFLWDKVSGAQALSRALAGAAGGGQLDVAKLLVEHGAIINGEVLSRAVQYVTPDKLVVLQYLLDKGADPDARYTQEGVGINGMTPLMLASYLNYYPQAWDVMILLVGYGADLDAKDNRGKTALDIARDSNQLDGIRFLKTAGELVTGTVMDAVSGKPVEGAVVSLDFLVHKAGEGQQVKLIQQSLTGANGRFFLHTWQNPLRREAGWALVPEQKPALGIYARGFQRLIVADNFSAKKGGSPNVDRVRALQPMQAKPGALLHELSLWKQELTPEVFTDAPDRMNDERTQEARRKSQKHLTMLFGSLCETLPNDVRMKACYQPCSTIDRLVQKYKYEDGWEKERIKAVAKAAREGVPLAPVMVGNTGCGYQITSLVVEESGIAVSREAPRKAERNRIPFVSHPFTLPLPARE